MFIRPISIVVVAVVLAVLSTNVHAKNTTANLIQDGSFESGSSYWLTAGGGSVVNDGTFARTGTNYGRAHNYSVLKIYYTIPKNAESIQVDYYYKYARSSACVSWGNFFQVYLQSMTIVGNAMNGYNPRDSSPVSEWKQANITKNLWNNTSATAGEFTINGTIYDAGCESNLYIDDVVITAAYPDTGYAYDGIAYYVSIPPDISGKTPVYRFRRADGLGHFYTASQDEKTSVEEQRSSELIYEGIAYYVAVPPDTTGYTPVYRFSRTDGKGHFYTASDSEKTTVQTTMQSRFTYDGIAYYVAVPPNTSGMTSVYRSSRKDQNGHFYTASKSEIESIHPERGF